MGNSTTVENGFKYYNEGGELCTAFMKMPKIVFYGSMFESVSLDAKNLYMLMLDRTALSIKNNWVDDTGNVYIFYAQAEAMAVMGYGRTKINQLFKELENNNLILRKKQGLKKADIIYVNDLSKLEFSHGDYAIEFKYTFLNAKDDQVKSLKKEVRELKKQLKLLEKQNVENSANAENNSDVETVENYVENSKNDTNANIKSYEKRTSRVMENEHQELWKTTPSNTNPNNTNHNNTNSINHSSQALQTEQSYQNFESDKFDDDDDKNSILNLIIKPTNTQIKNTQVKTKQVMTKQVITDLISSDIVQDASMVELFANSLNFILTNKKYHNYQEDFNDKLFNQDNDGMLNNLAKQSVSDFVNGSTHTNIIYPTQYMCKCIINALNYENISTVDMPNTSNNTSNNTNTSTSYSTQTSTSYSNNTNSSTNKPLPNTTYDIAEADEWLNTVPKLV